MSFSDMGKIAAIFGFVILGIYGMIYLTTQISMDTADRRGEAEKMEQVEAEGEYRVAQHDYFYNLCSDIKAKQQNIKELETLGGYDQEVVANRMKLNEMVSEYNTAASNNYTKGQFRADELPYQIDPDTEVEECGKP